MALYIYAMDSSVKAMLTTQLQTHRFTDSGFDVPLRYKIVKTGDKDDDIYTFKLGIQVAAVNEKGEPTPCLLLPRSSIYKTPFRMCNSIGLIDAGYRGEVRAKVDILNEEYEDFEVTAESRFFQICQHNFLPWNSIILVDNEEALPSPPDNRGSGGFGSTGR
jgi:dUTP pyrophosphatase